MVDEKCLRDLLQPEAYPWRPAHIQFIETHVSWVFLAGNRVVKVKRPVVFPFVDHRREEARYQSCRDEMRLNQRLTDGVYLGVVPIRRTDRGCRVDLDSGDPIVEHATLMRRLPADRMLDVLLRADQAPEDLARRLADRLLPFHLELAPVCAGAPQDVANVATAVVRDNLDEAEQFAGKPLAAVQLALVAAAMRRFITENNDLFVRRARDGWVREGHGDLRAEHVCLEEDGQVQIFDCVEFNRDVRCADVASDLAYMVMDLRRLGAPGVADELLARYRAAGIDLPQSFIQLYMAHRALVRAKIAGIAFSTASGDDRWFRAEKAAGYLDMASAAVLSVGPVLVAMTGLSGAGKSSVAQRLARVLGMPSFASDVVRKELAGVQGAAPADWGEGIYRSDMTEATYARLRELAADSLAEGAGVVLDATYRDGEQRQALAVLAARYGVPLVLVEVTCDEEVVAQRLAERVKRGDSVSDATIETNRRQRQQWEASPPPIPKEAMVVRVDTSGELPFDLDEVLSALQEAGMVRGQLDAGAD